MQVILLSYKSREGEMSLMFTGWLGARNLRSLDIGRVLGLDSFIVIKIPIVVHNGFRFLLEHKEVTKRPRT